MRVYYEKELKYFEWWGPAVDNAATLTWAQLDYLEELLEEDNPDGIDAVSLNDLMAYYFPIVQKWLGITPEEE